MDNCLRMLGLAKKAGFLEVGEECVSDSVMFIKARCILSASDAAAGSVRKAGFLAEDASIPHIVLPYTKADIGEVVGRGMPGMLSITDIGMAHSFVSKLVQEHPKHADVLQVMDKKLKRANERKAAKKNESTKTVGKRRTNK